MVTPTQIPENPGTSRLESTALPSALDWAVTVRPCLEIARVPLVTNGAQRCLTLPETTMRLILSSPHPRNSAYSTEDGQVLYKVDKPRKLRNEIATVRKAVNTVNGVWEGDFSFKKGATSPLLDVEPQEKNELDKDGERRSMNSQDGLFNNSDTEDDASGQSTSKEPASEGHFAFYAQVEYHTFASSRFRYNSLDVSVSDYFRKEGWSWYGRGRVFKACDGEEYRWDLRAGHLEMIKNDGSKKRAGFVGGG
ncbi:hypothetical protein Agabi119p4_3959 [Agaricus bisporus var. burnettii]|uniref:DUF6593 domain-containing protein n=1 Tax=Agaricus bisporus var. burnettii TaxID=192524 RepID=A0A8H7F5T0_AGABI|nr:hypothetical protein Agabi119p4_3959 [Agaricus bisporus var. burnettii]